MSKNRAELTAELEIYFGKPVFLITYNYSSNPPIGFIEPDDEFYFRQFRDDVLTKKSIHDCVLILNGPGGNIKTAIACSQFLRDALLRYDSFVPTVVGSSLCYFVLQSNRLFLGDKTKITQIDPLFNYEGVELRAIEHLNNPNQEIRKLAHEIHSKTFENIKRILKDKSNVFKKEVSVESQQRVGYAEKVVKFWMKKSKHGTPLPIEELKKLKVNFKYVPTDIIDKAKHLINECQKELVEEDKRFVIQTSNIEDKKYFGGYFYS